MPVMRHRFLLPITGVFVATLLIANTLDNKIFDLLGLALPAGIVVFPLSYLAGDILTEVYGYATARRVVWTGFLGLILMVASYQLAEALPSAGFWTGQDAFAATLGQAPRIALASITAYFLGEFVNSFVVAKMKVWTQGRRMAGRFVLSTVAGELVDTLVFVGIAFLGVLPLAELPMIILSAWAVKVVWEVIALPITIPVVRLLKRVEHEDHYDTTTDFSPFRL